MATLIPVAGSAIALAGADKLLGNRGYVDMFHHLGWSDAEMRAAAVAETLGGLLMVPQDTRRIGGVAVAAVSALVMFSEVKQGETKLAGPRALVMLAGLLAAFAPGGQASATKSQRKTYKR